MLGLPYQSRFAGEVEVNERTIDGQQLRWSIFRDFPAPKMFALIQDWVFPFIKNLSDDKDGAYSRYMDDAIFKIPTPLVLSDVVDALDEIYEMKSQISDADINGDIYEYLLTKTKHSGLIGQFRTPRHIVRMMVEMMAPTPEDTICEIIIPSLIQNRGIIKKYPVAV